MPTIPSELAEIIATHKALFGGFTMTADQAADKLDSADPKADEKAADGAKPNEDKPLGPNGEKALQQERQARQELERQIRELAPLKAQMDAIAAVFGGEAKGAKPEDAVAALANEFGTLKSDLEVERLARTHGITDEKDIDLLRKTSADARSDLAARLKPTTIALGGPRPDPSIGMGGGGSKANSSSVSAGRELFTERHQKTQTKNS